MSFRLDSRPIRRQNSQLSEDELPEEPGCGGTRTKIRPEYLPETWDDDVRMNAFFTDFRARELNPAAYDSKMKFWTDVVTRCIVHDDLVTFSVTDLREKLQRKGRRPHCISTVLSEMHRTKRVVTIQEFFSAAQESWVAWGYDMVKKPISWSASLMFGSPGSLEHTRFVDMELLKAKAGDVLDRANSGSLPSSALGLQTFKELFGDLVNEQTIPLVLKHLQRNKQLVVNDLDDPEHATIKFLRQGQTGSSADKRKVANISEVDRAIVKLRRSLQNHENEASSMHTKVEELDIKLRALVRAGKKPVAMRVLKEKKLLEKRLTLRDAAISNIGKMLFQLENSENDENVFDAYQAGLSALKTAQQDTSLEKIEGLTDDLQEVVDLQEEIAQAISTPIRGLDDADDEALEQELKDLLNDDDDVTEDLISELEKLKIPHGLPKLASQSPQSPLAKKTGPQNSQQSQ